MNPRILFVLLPLLFTMPFSLEANPKPPTTSNITVIGAVFCDPCSNNIFTKNSYFLQGAKVLVECKFKSNSTREDISITTDRTTDRFGMYKIDIPPVDGFECREGREIESSCRATLVGSSSPLCNSPGLRSSTEHVALKCREANLCVFNLNALNYKPTKRDAALCGTSRDHLSTTSPLNSSLFFWPPFGFPWPQLPTPPPLPFPFPPIPFFTPTPSLPFQFPPWFPFPKPPSLPFPFSPAANPPALPSFSPPPSPPPPPPSSIPWPFPTFPPLVQAPGLPSPPPSFSLGDPRTWFPFYPPPSSNGQPEDHKP